MILAKIFSLSEVHPGDGRFGLRTGLKAFLPRSGAGNDSSIDLRGAGEIRTLVTTLTTAAVLGMTTGCSDLALEPDQHPTALSLLPVDTMLLEGQTAVLRFVVTDQNQQTFASLPTWALPNWSISNPSILSV